MCGEKVKDSMSCDIALNHIVELQWFKQHNQTSMVQTLMARLPWLF